MNYNSLVSRISTDLKINKYDNETNEEHGNRLIYTALAAWARTLVLGESYADLDNQTENTTIYYHNVDIMHIQSRLTQIAYGMLMTIPHCKTWIANRSSHNASIEVKSSHIASEIIKSLIFCYELSPLNNIRRITKSPSKIVTFKKHQLILGGEKWRERDKAIISVGLGRWTKMSEERADENYRQIFNLPNYTPDEYYYSLLNSALWKDSNLDGQYKIFKTGTGLFYNKAWVDLNISKLNHGMYLLKSTDIDGGFLLIKKERDKIYTARLDKWYCDENEIYRIMYVLDHHNNTPTIFKAEIHDDYVLLHCHSVLPNSEMRILLMSSWPKRYYDDIYYRIIPKFIWDEIEMVLANLGIKIKYINKEGCRHE